ncbi:polygalacturonase At1g48100 isoform X2 [Amborella trichopoda]|uniref:polygalacturonase At1g48100 isoform X2 n=1 Tax=Amborella trichopoda TaxID=13333 RepID=UPI0009BCEA94|nr:polygalacturonase At1g48100 isoform X2 [Amborella trichopoda]|eukprot:XP_020521048.1 polygalacturonase At1g48100 isoform X2 [Amborella trichopoda]
MVGICFKILVSFVLFFLIFLNDDISRVAGSDGKRLKKKHKSSGKGSLPLPSDGGCKGSYPPPAYRDRSENAFDVLNFGAVGDGVTDDTKLEGTIVAPTKREVWGRYGMLQWIQFSKLRGITVSGQGVIDGRGAAWWGGSSYQQITGQFSKVAMPSIKPTALRFYGSFNVMVTGITIQNSPQCHLKFDACTGVIVSNINVLSPGDSLNTDGIHLQNSKDVLVQHSNFACGDDCVSIQTGCSNVYLHDINCGPGHGISIGGLGRDNTKACVSNVTVRNVVIRNTMHGVRIKTWQGGSGSVQGVLFSNVQVFEVQFPIVIDQFYCDRRTCKNQTAAVALEGITYENIRGTYTIKPMHFACSDSVPCMGVVLNNIQLHPIQEAFHMYDADCWHAYGVSLATCIPPISCLQAEKPSKGHIQSNIESC